MKHIYLSLLLFLSAILSQAQIVDFPYSEGFEGSAFPPSDWVSYAVVSGDMEFVRVTEGEWPDCLPHDGSIAMAQYNSFSASAGEEAVLISPEMTLTDDNVLRFWFYRSEDPSNNRRDKIEVYYNTTPDLNGAIFLDSINRAVNFYPVVTTEDWYQYSFEFSSPEDTYIIFKTISAYGWKMFLDDVYVETNTIDIDPPEVIELDGTQVYANQDMNLLLRVRDMSAMPETLDGEATIDGNIFDVLMTKISGEQGDFIYEGSIAGQQDHTEGEIKFWLIDDLGNSIWSDYYQLNWDWIQPLLEEGFEGELFPPENWDVTGAPLTWLGWTDYGMVYYTDSDLVEYEVYPVEGERQAAVEWDFQGNVQNEWMISPIVSIDQAATLSFNTFVRLSSSDWDDYLVKVTTDGVNWNTIWSAADYPAGVSNYEDKVELDLEEFVGSDIRVAWHAYNLQGTNLWYSWFVDDVKIRISDTIVGINENIEIESSAYPNPFTNTTHINFSLNSTGKVILFLYNNEGRIVIKESYNLTSTGNQSIKIENTSLTAGYYYYQIVTKEGIIKGKLIRK